MHCAKGGVTVVYLKNVLVAGDLYLSRAAHSRLKAPFRKVEFTVLKLVAPNVLVAAGLLRLKVGQLGEEGYFLGVFVYADKALDRRLDGNCVTAANI